MIILLNDLPRKIRLWYRFHTYRMYDFRILFEEQQAISDPQKKKQLEAEILHPRKKVEQHNEYGISLGISEDQIKEFNLAIIMEVKKRKLPKAIIETLIKESSHK